MIPVLTPALIEAYRETHYIITSDPPVTLVINQYSLALQRLQQAFNVQCSAFITACNPFSRLQSQKDNEQCMQAMNADLRVWGFTPLCGVAMHPAGQWPPEPSFWVPGLSLEQGKTLVLRYRQNAFVYASCDAKPMLSFHPSLYR